MTEEQVPMEQLEGKPEVLPKAEDRLTRENLEFQVQCLAICRRAADRSKKAVDETQAQIALLVKVSLLGKKLNRLLDLLGLDREALAAQDTGVRQLAVELFKAEGEQDKRPHKGVGINVRTHIHYDPKVALTYAMLHYPGAVKLDKRAFDKIAKATPHDFVTISQDPSATIDRDLSAYLPEEKQDEKSVEKVD